MAIIKLTISDGILDKVMGLLSPFKGKGLEIEHLDASMEEHKKYVHEQLELMDSGQAKYITIEELDQQLKETIKKYAS